MSLVGLERAVLLPEEQEEQEVTGDITSTQTSGFLSKMSSSLRLPSPAVREWLANRRKTIRPWMKFANANSFSTPESLPKWSKRLMKNVGHFQSNYVFVFLGLFLYCLLTSPLLLVAIGGAAGACHLLHVRQAERPLVVAGRQVALTQQYLAVALLSVPVFLLVGASSALFWVLGASFFVILLHASFFKSESLEAGDEEEELFEVTMESV